MADAIHLVSVEACGGVGTEAATSINDDKGGEFFLHAGGQVWTVERRKADYQTLSGAPNIKKMFFDERNRALLNHHGWRRDTDTGQ